MPGGLMHRGTDWRGHSEKAPVCKPRREAPGDTAPACSVTLQPPELRQNKFLLFFYPVCDILSWQPEQTDHSDCGCCWDTHARESLFYFLKRNSFQHYFGFILNRLSQFCVYAGEYGIRLVFMYVHYKGMWSHQLIFMFFSQNRQMYFQKGSIGRIFEDMFSRENMFL